MQLLDHPEWMGRALHEAHRAAALGEVPVGALVVIDGKVITAAHNRREIDRDPSAHAELLAIRAAAAVFGRWRLDGATIYTTLEPCPMCAGAMIAARLDRVVFGARDPKAGACGSVVDLFVPGSFNHRPDVMGDVMAEACGSVLREFFAKRREGTVKSKRLRSLPRETGGCGALRKRGPERWPSPVEGV